MSKQKIVFDLFLIFGATMSVYVLFRSSSYVHIIALVVLVIGILYVLQYNAYRIRLFGLDISAEILPSGGKGDQPSKDGDKWWETDIPSLISKTTSDIDNSKWMSTM
jgi:hypothetical protein